MKRRRRTREEWKKILVAWRKSGLTGDEFSTQRGLSSSNLYRWSGKLGIGMEIRKGSSASPRIPPSRMSDQSATGFAAGEVRIVPIPSRLLSSVDDTPGPRKSSRLTLIVGRRFRVAVPDEFSSLTLGRLIRTLEAL